MGLGRIDDQLRRMREKVHHEQHMFLRRQEARLLKILSQVHKDAINDPLLINDSIAQDYGARRHAVEEAITRTQELITENIRQLHEADWSDIGYLVSGNVAIEDQRPLRLVETA